jgi:uncharacterized protein (UPF0147 family)
MIRQWLWGSPRWVILCQGHAIFSDTIRWLAKILEDKTVPRRITAAAVTGTC